MRMRVQVGSGVEFRKWQLNEAFAYGRLAPLASVYCPVEAPSPEAVPHLRLQLQDTFQSSALLAAALDTATMTYRLRQGYTPASLGAATGVPEYRAFE